MFNRIDRILTYDPLDQSTVERIAHVRLDELKRRDGWQSHGDRFDIDEAALTSLSRAGYQPQYGARPLTREVERSVVVPLAEAICESGRQKKLSTQITAPGADEESAKNQILVSVNSDPAKRKRADESVVALIEEMTTLRRRGQALDRCDALRRLRNQYTMVNRKLKTLLRAAKNQDQREKIRYGPLGVDRMQTRERILLIRKLCRDIDDAESRLLAKYYRGEAIEQKAAAEQIDVLHIRLWDMLCELHSESGTDNQRMTLVLTGPNLTAAKLLLEAYCRFSDTRNWNLQVHALLRRSKEAHDGDRVIDCAGWSGEPAFRVATDRGQVSAVLEELDLLSSEREKPRLAAYRLIRSESLSMMPNGTLGLMLTFRGKNAGLMMGGEAGVHTFNRLQKSKSSGCSILISKHLRMPIEYVAPEWLTRRDFQVIGHPRRWYDVETGLVRDMTESHNHTVKMDREGRWLESLIERETEQRIWAELDQDAGDSDIVDSVDIPY
jgi:hypothetical protein